jgi:hypothetical protein
VGTLFAIFGVLAYQTTHLSGTVAIYPGYVLGVLWVLLIGIAISEFRWRGKLDLDSELAEFWPALRRPRAELGGFIVLWLIYALILNAVGFLVATALAVAAGLLLLRLRRLRAIAGGAVVFSLVMAVVVKAVLYVPVPVAAPDLALERLIFLLRTGG